MSTVRSKIKKLKLRLAKRGGLHTKSRSPEPIGTVTCGRWHPHKGQCRSPHTIWSTDKGMMQFVVFWDQPK